MYIGIEVPDTKYHVTLAFCGHKDTLYDYWSAISAAVQAARGTVFEKPVITFSDLHKFEDGPWVVNVEQNSGLEYMRQLLVYGMDASGLWYATEYDFHPHATITYYKKPKKNPLEGLTFEPTHISVVSDKHGTIRVPLNSEETV